SPSTLRPPCPAPQRLFLWRGINTPPASTLSHPVLTHLDHLASQASLSDAASYGAGLRKFHLFCDIFSVPESDRLPASLPVLKSFAFVPFEPISIVAVRKYLAAVRAWHLAQGWPPPLNEDELTQLNWSLRGLDRLQAAHRHRPPRPPVSLHMLSTLRSALHLQEPFDAAVWAAATCSFWGMMHFGEVSVPSRNAFQAGRHISRGDCIMSHDLDNRPYARLRLPSAKTARPGETQDVFVTQQGELCAIWALINLSMVVPAAPSDHLFSWKDAAGSIHPLTRQAALNRINNIFQAHGWGTAFGHSFRIGGASFYLAQKVSPEIVRIAGRWKSLAYETYIRTFENVASRHM
ncbi:hypothetical protein BDY19DRAFT_855238, partial [Irpex rosettiformis]